MILWTFKHTNTAYDDVPETYLKMKVITVIEGTTGCKLVPTSFRCRSRFAQTASLYMRTRYTDRNLMSEVYFHNYSVVLLSTGGLFQDRRSVPRADFLQVHLVAWLVVCHYARSKSQIQIHKYTNIAYDEVSEILNMFVCEIFITVLWGTWKW